LLGRNENYSLIAVKAGREMIGKFVDVKIIKSFPHYLIGEIVD